MKVLQRMAMDSLAEKEIFKLAAVTANINILFQCISFSISYSKLGPIPNELKFHICFSYSG